MKKILTRLFTAIFTIFLIGCALESNHHPVQQLQPTTRIVEKAVTIPPPDLKAQYHLSYGSNPALKKAYQQYLSSGKAPHIISDGFEQFAYGIGNQPIIAANPLALTVISLEPGENVTNVSSGDPLRWSYSLAYSGQGKLRQAQIMIKPAQNDISTDLVITTDKRFYTLHLTAPSNNNGKYAHNVRFWYPQDMQEYWNNYNAEQTQKVAQEQQNTIVSVPNVNLNNLNFNYGLAHNGWTSPSWKPIRVFDDGTHTYIQFPPTLSSRDMPVLFILSGNSKELVNYRAKAPYFVIDKIFQKAVLVTGVGNGQKTVTVINYKF